MNRHVWQRRLALLLTSALMAVFGFTSVASANSITNTGPQSTNSIDTNVENECTVKNNNHVTVKNGNWQNGSTGDADVSDNTTAGSAWSGWSSLDPSKAMADGVSHDAWWNGVVDWMSQHSSPSGWSGNGDNPSWTPGGTDWASNDPMTWQANGQSFDNWWNAAQHYLDGNSSGWLLGWPKDATGSGNFGGNATTGSVVNKNNSSFTIAINNTAAAAAGVNACGKSNFVPPVITPPSVTPPSITPPSSIVVPPQVTPGTQSAFAPSSVGGGQGGAGSSFGAGKGKAAPSVIASAGVSQTPPTSSAGASTSPPAVTPPPVSPPQKENVISNTGPGSSNTISANVSNETTVKNTNNVTVNNSNWQSGNTGDATVTDNTTAGSATSGNVYNVNKTRVDVDVSN